MLKELPTQDECLQLLVNFYNLRLNINKDLEKEADKEDLIGTWTIPAKDQRRLLKFFEKCTDVATYKTVKEYLNAEAKLGGATVFGTLGGYAQRDETWWESLDSQLFLQDYERICRIVSSIREDQKIQSSDYSWFLGPFQKGLYIEYAVRMTPRYRPKDLDEAKTILLRQFDEDEGVKREDVTVEVGFDFFSGGWHGLALNELRYAINTSIVILFDGKVKTRVCTLDGCDKIFIDTGRIRGFKQKYCSSYHRKKASELRTEKERLKAS